MKNLKNWILLVSIIILSSGCKKTDFLDKKPSSDILQPTTLKEFEQLLDNNAFVMNFTGALSQMGADDYYISNVDWQTASSTERNSYIWAKDIYNGDVAIPDWNKLYSQVFYCNVVLEGLEKNNLLNTTDGQFLKGWALFARAFAFYDLARTFCKSYDRNTASSDLGLPLRLSSGIDYLEKRSTLQKTIDQIFTDLNSCLNILPSGRPSTNLNRPSKIAVYALFARINLDLRDYVQAEGNATKALNLYSTLMDYNNLNINASIPFSKYNEELIYYSTQVNNYSSLTITSASTKAKVLPELINLYSPNDARKALYFRLLSDGSYGKKIGYNGYGNYHFTGLATDELFLIKAECMARRGDIQGSMDFLNQLIVKRWKPNATVPAVPYLPITAANGKDALDKILLERRKELVWRGLRWQDLKRLNKEGANITLKRSMNGMDYILPPNDPRYVFPIPDDEIALSGLEQNIR